MAKVLAHHFNAQDLRDCPMCGKEWIYQPIEHLFDPGDFCPVCRHTKYPLVIEEGMKGQAVAALTEDMCKWTDETL